MHGSAATGVRPARRLSPYISDPGISACLPFSTLHLFACSKRAVSMPTTRKENIARLHGDVCRICTSALGAPGLLLRRGEVGLGLGLGLLLGLGLEVGLGLGSGSGLGLGLGLGLGRDLELGSGPGLGLGLRLALGVGLGLG